MKTLCVAVVVLSLTSVCQSAPLTCEQLKKPLDKSPNVSGTWYIIALSSDYCLSTALLNSFVWPSMAVDVTAQDTPHVYNANFTFNMYGSCASEVEPFFLAGSSLFKVDNNNAAIGEPDRLLMYTGCPDCIVGKAKNSISMLVLFSRRKTVTDAELKEFEKQSDCLGWYKPEVLNTDHVYVNCKSFEDQTDEEMSAASAMMLERFKGLFTAPLKCISQKVLYYPSAAVGWFQETWSSIW